MSPAVPAGPEEMSTTWLLPAFWLKKKNLVPTFPLFVQFDDTRNLIRV